MSGDLKPEACVSGCFVISQSVMLYGKQNDDYNLVYIAHFFLGTSVLLLWKTFITPYDYFTDIYPDFNFEFWFASLFWTPTLPALFLVVCLVI